MQAQWDWGTAKPNTVIVQPVSDTFKTKVKDSNFVAFAESVVIPKLGPIRHKLDSAQAVQLNEILEYLKWNTTNCEKFYSVTAGFKNNKFSDILQCPISEQDTLKKFFAQVFEKMKVQSAKPPNYSTLKYLDTTSSQHFFWFSSFLNNNYPEAKRYTFWVNPDVEEVVNRKITALFPDTCSGFYYLRKITLKYLKNGKAVFVDSDYSRDIGKKIAKIIAQYFYWDSAKIIDSNTAHKVVLPIKSKNVLDNQKLHIYRVSQFSSERFSPPKYKNNFKLNFTCTDFKITHVVQVQNWRNPSDKSDVIDTMYYSYPSEFPKPIEISVKANKYYSVFLDKNTQLEFMLQKIKIRGKWKYYITTFDKDNLGYTPIIYSKNIAFIHISGYKEYQFEMAIE